MFNTFDELPFLYDPWEGKKRKKNAAWKNNKAFYNWFVYFAELYMNQIAYDGLPEDIPQRYVSQIVFLDGKILAFEDKTKGFMMTKCSGIGQQNVYWEFEEYRTDANRYYETYSADDSVLVRENLMSYPPVFMVESLAAQVSDASRQIEVYARTMKRPFLVDGTANTQLKLNVLADQIDENELLVISRGNMASEIFNPVPNRMDANGLMALWRHKHELISEFATFSGLNNANTEKRERMITSEVESNDQFIKAALNKTLDWLNEGLDKVYKRFGVRITAREKHPQEVEKNGEMDDRASESSKDNANI